LLQPSHARPLTPAPSPGPLPRTLPYSPSGATWAAYQGIDKEPRQCTGRGSATESTICRHPGCSVHGRQPTQTFPVAALAESRSSRNWDQIPLLTNETIGQSVDRVQHRAHALRLIEERGRLADRPFVPKPSTGAGCQGSSMADLVSIVRRRPLATCCSSPAVLASTIRPANCLADAPRASGRPFGRALPSRPFPAHPGPGSLARGRALATLGRRRHLRRRRRSMLAGHRAARRSADRSMALGGRASLMAGCRSSGQAESGPLSHP
jgi:hypothetical protein